MIERIKSIFETYKIKKIIKAYNFLKKENPNLSEEELCLRLIADRLYITRRTNNRAIKKIEDADYFVKRMLKGKILNIEQTCAWIMCNEYHEDALKDVVDGNFSSKLEKKLEKEKYLENKAKGIKIKIK